MLPGPGPVTEKGWDSAACYQDNLMPRHPWLHLHAYQTPAPSSNATPSQPTQILTLYQGSHLSPCLQALCLGKLLVLPPGNFLPIQLCELKHYSLFLAICIPPLGCQVTVSTFLQVIYKGHQVNEDPRESRAIYVYASAAESHTFIPTASCF